MNEEPTSLRNEVRQELRQGLATLTRRVDGLDERIRANGVLLEALRDDVRQIAEAHVLLAAGEPDPRTRS
jgi:hypothetical protein